MKTYTIKVVIHEGCDEWWEEITKGNKSGAEEVRKMVEDALAYQGFMDDDCTVTLDKFEKND